MPAASSRFRPVRARVHRVRLHRRSTIPGVPARPGRLRRLGAATAGLALAVALTACGSTVAGTVAAGPGPVTTTVRPTTGTDTTGTTARPTTAGSTRTSTTGTAATDVTFDNGLTLTELEGDLDAAVTVTDTFWSTHWSEYFTGEYVPPTITGLYDGLDPSTAPVCDGEPLEAYNAFYCSADDTLSWDVNLIVDGSAQIGDSFPYLVIAHEWGHAIQARLDPSLVAAGYELQADCLGAAALFGAAADGTLQFDGGDTRELVNSLSALGDEMAWATEADHGDSFQRVGWFDLGRTGGVPACIAAAGDPTRDTVTQTPDLTVAPSAPVISSDPGAEMTAPVPTDLPVPPSQTPSPTS